MNTLFRGCDGVYFDSWKCNNFFTMATYQITQSKEGKTRRDAGKGNQIESNRESIKDIILASLLTGSTIIPCYSTGDSETLRLNFTGYTGYAVSAVMSILPISVCVFSGRWGLPLPYR